MIETDVLIIGAGAVGLAVAAELGQKVPNLSVTVMERHDRFGQEISSRNSEVIHSGIYYPTGSIKARLCVAGKEYLYRFCRNWGVPFSRPGKLIVARSEAELSDLEKLAEQARVNGIDDIELLDRAHVARLEPNVMAGGALFSRSTGVLDSHRFLSMLEWVARQKGAIIAYCHRVTGVEPRKGGYLVQFINPDRSTGTICCTWLINCAGLEAATVASWLGIDPDQAGYRLYPCKGEYFSIAYAKSKLVGRLIYPLPLRNLEGLGVHLTKSLDGRLRLGPNALYVDEISYHVEPSHRIDFFQAAKNFLPFLELDDLEPEMAGIRPKLQGPGQPFRDFVVNHEVERGLKGVINLIGIESPGLTACLSLARLVAGYIA